MENIRRRIKIVFRQKTCVANIETDLQTFQNFDESLVGVELAQTALEFSKPTYSGFTILDLSKLLMYNWHCHYETMPLYFPCNTLLYTDTDSFIYHIKINNLYEYLTNPTVAQHFNIFNYPSEHPLYSEANRAVTGKMKDETQRVIR